MIQQCAAIEFYWRHLYPDARFLKDPKPNIEIKSKDYNVKALVYNIICKTIHHYWYPDLSLKRKKKQLLGSKKFTKHTPRLNGWSVLSTSYLTELFFAILFLVFIFLKRTIVFWLTIMCDRNTFWWLILRIVHYTGFLDPKFKTFSRLNFFQNMNLFFQTQGYQIGDQKRP